MSIRTLTCILLGGLALIGVGCSRPTFPAPEPVAGGSFLVHRVRSTEETLPKVLTWYTGTTLSQQLVVKYNPYTIERPLQVGDHIFIPVEVIANDRPYGEDSPRSTAPASNLLMEGATTPTPAPRPGSSTVETFDDESSPDAPVIGTQPSKQTFDSPL